MRDPKGGDVEGEAGPLGHKTMAKRNHSTLEVSNPLLTQRLAGFFLQRGKVGEDLGSDRRTSGLEVHWLPDRAELFIPIAGRTICVCLCNLTTATSRKKKITHIQITPAGSPDPQELGDARVGAGSGKRQSSPDRSPGFQLLKPVPTKFVGLSVLVPCMQQVNEELSTSTSEYFSAHQQAFVNDNVQVMRLRVDATSAMGVAESSKTENVSVVNRSLRSFSGVAICDVDRLEEQVAIEFKRGKRQSGLD